MNLYLHTEYCFRPPKRNFTDRVHSSKNVAMVPKTITSTDSSESCECFYCHEVGHLIATCPALKCKVSRKASPSKSVALIERQVLSPELNVSLNSVVEPTLPFICDGVVSLSEDESDVTHIRILRDTGAAQSFILESVLPFFEQSSCGSNVLVQGIGLTVVKVPLHKVFLWSGIISGNVKLAVRAELPVKGVSLILGNDLAGGKVFLSA